MSFLRRSKDFNPKITFLETIDEYYFVLCISSAFFVYIMRRIKQIYSYQWWNYIRKDVTITENFTWVQKENCKWPTCKNFNREIIWKWKIFWMAVGGYMIIMKFLVFQEIALNCCCHSPAKQRLITKIYSSFQYLIKCLWISIWKCHPFISIINSPTASINFWNRIHFYKFLQFVCENICWNWTQSILKNKTEKKKMFLINRSLSNINTICQFTQGATYW